MKALGELCGCWLCRKSVYFCIPANYSPTMRINKFHKNKKVKVIVSQSFKELMLNLKLDKVLDWVYN
jgi:hypothetical protein